uniref:Uncharacterized protein n=1 Tax=Thermodesulfobacterium geofontis TaxID=1295609 RepID=A0A7C4JRH6_9BACT
MKKVILALGVSLFIFAGNIYSYSESAIDQASGTSGDSYHATHGFSDEDARERAGQGFDTNRSSNLSGGGMEYIPMPNPKVDKEANQN